MRARHEGSKTERATRGLATLWAAPCSAGVATVLLAATAFTVGAGASTARGSSARIALPLGAASGLAGRYGAFADGLITPGNAEAPVGGSAGPAGRPVPHPERTAAARFLVARSSFMAESGQKIAVTGRLLTAGRRLKVRLMARAGAGWHVVGRGWTVRGGRFRIRYTVQSVGSTNLRVSVSVPGVAHASAPAGQVVGLAPSVASWYDDAGNTACGFHATYGVANRTLPCGTHVTISYGGHSVVATVDDRGPFVYGRSYDLNQNTARALDMFGVAQVFTSV